MIEHRIRNEIKRLRARGMSYAEIRTELRCDFPNGTLSYICKDVVLPADYLTQHKKRLQDNLQRARAKATIANKEKLAFRFKRIHQDAERIVELRSKGDYDKICLAMLYVAEGAKYKSYRGLSMGSSDPEILQIYIALLERCYYKKREDFRARVQCRDDQNQEELKTYWTEQLGLLPDAFYLSYSDKRTIGKPTRNIDYKGVCVISCSGADIQLELDAIARIYKQKIWGVSSFG